MAKQADTDAPYSPPLTLTPALLNRVAAIAETLGRWSARQDALPSPRLRRENRIHTIQASLAIEQNSLSIEQVSALFDGQRVLGPARDIQEVRNAITAYDALPRWDPANHEHLLAAHGLLMAGLIDAPGRFRRGGDALRSEMSSEMSWEIRSEKGSELAAELGGVIGAERGLAIDQRILGDLASEPTLSARRLAERLQLSPRAVEKHLAALQRAGCLLRHGSPRAGYWQVL
jgi:DNA-binding transcriptional ArsR family regulator